MKTNDGFEFELMLSMSRNIFSLKCAENDAEMVVLAIVLVRKLKLYANYCMGERLMGI